MSKSEHRGIDGIKRYTLERTYDCVMYADHVAAVEALRAQVAGMEMALAKVHLLADSGLTWATMPIEEIRAELRAHVRAALAEKPR